MTSMEKSSKQLIIINHQNNVIKTYICIELLQSLNQNSEFYLTKYLKIAINLMHRNNCINSGKHKGKSKQLT